MSFSLILGSLGSAFLSIMFYLFYRKGKADKETEIVKEDNVIQEKYLDIESRPASDADALLNRMRTDKDNK